MNLAAFLMGNARRGEDARVVVSPRFVDEQGEPVAWRVCTITALEDERLRQACTQRVPLPGKRGQYTQETDYNAYLGSLAARCTVYPNLNDAALQNSYGVMGAEDVLKAMLLPGEYAEYLARVQEINGFDVTLQEQVDEIKNA